MGLEIVHGEELDGVMQENGVELTDGQLAVGLKVPTSVKTPVGYLDHLRKYKDIYNDIYKQMEVSNKLYKYNPIIGNAIDVLVDFAISGLSFDSTGNKKLDDLLSFWFASLNRDNSNSQAGMYVFCEELALEFFTSGNAFPYCKWDNVSLTGDDKQRYKLPMSINLINPQSIEIPKGPIAFGQEVIMLKYDSELMTKLQTDGRSDPEAALIKQAIPRSVLNSIKNQKFGHEGIRLNPRYISHIKRRAKGYQAWGVPYLSRVLTDASLMDRLRELDESITSGLINLVTIFKIGTEEHPATPSRLRRFAALITNPKATTTLVWAHDVEMIQVGPDGKVLQYKDKYRDIKENLLIAMGIPPVLMSLPQQGDPWVSILALVERLVGWRKRISLWIEQEAHKIVQFNDIPNIDHKKIKVKWERMNLVDEQSIKNLVLSMYDRGLLSVETALQESDHNIETEKTNKQKEKKDGDLWINPDLPFSGKQEEKKGEVKKAGPTKNDKSQTTKTPSTKTDQTVNLQQQKKKEKPKAPKR